MMEGAAHKLLEAATHRTLHAHGFTRSSSQASLVLTDLLSRYLALLALTCAKYAQHANRTGIDPWDALCALDELGVDVNELNEYCGSEGHDFRRFAALTARRLEDLHEFRGHLSRGLRQDRGNAVKLVYAPVQDIPESEEENIESEVDQEEESIALPPVRADKTTRSVDSILPEVSFIRRRTHSSTLLSSPPIPYWLPSEPSSSSRTLVRPDAHRSLEYIPDFLPPFPTDEDTVPDAGLTAPPDLPPAQLPPLKVEKPPSLLTGPLTSASAPDYLARVPYSQSSLASTPEWHLPLPAPPPPPTQFSSRRLPTPQPQQALFSAYHHILTHPPPPNATDANPARHRVAMALLSLTQTSSRWDPTDTLYSTTTPGAPRVAAIGPTFPLPIVSGKVNDAKAEEKDRRLPPAFPRPVSATERLSPLVSSQSSRIPDLARIVLPSTVYSRTTKLHHPGILSRGEKKLTYGPGVKAPWNVVDGGATSPSKDDGAQGGLPNGKASGAPSKAVLQDAMLFATWDYEPKSFREPLALGRRGRTGSVAGSGLVLNTGL